jgi:hypothetical protein
MANALRVKRGGGRKRGTRATRYRSHGESRTKARGAGRTIFRARAQLQARNRAVPAGAVKNARGAGRSVEGGERARRRSMHVSSSARPRGRRRTCAGCSASPSPRRWRRCVCSSKPEPAVLAGTGRRTVGVECPWATARDQLPTRRRRRGATRTEHSVSGSRQSVLADGDARWHRPPEDGGAPGSATKTTRCSFSRAPRRRARDPCTGRLLVVLPSGSALALEGWATETDNRQRKKG